MPTVIERINAGLSHDTPSRVEWRSLLETALFEIERLQGERDQYLKSSVEYGNLSERLRAALKPFAQAAKQFAPYPESMADRPSESTFTLGDLRTAARAYEQTRYKSEE